MNHYGKCRKGDKRDISGPSRFSGRQRLSLSIQELCLLVATMKSNVPDIKRPSCPGETQQSLIHTLDGIFLQTSS